MAISTTSRVLIYWFGISRDVPAFFHHVGSMSATDYPHQLHQHHYLQLKVQLRTTHLAHTNQFATAHTSTTLTLKTTANSGSVLNTVVSTTCLVLMD